MQGHGMSRVGIRIREASSAGFPPLPEPRISDLTGVAEGQRLSPDGGKVSERSEFFRCPRQVRNSRGFDGSGACFLCLLSLHEQ